MQVVFLYLSANNSPKKPKYLASKWSRRVQSAFVQTAWFVSVEENIQFGRGLSNFPIYCAFYVTQFWQCWIMCEINEEICAVFLRQTYLVLWSWIYLHFKKLVKCYIWSMALYGAETWTLRATDQKYLESFEMWCWRRME